MIPRNNRLVDCAPPDCLLSIVRVTKLYTLEDEWFFETNTDDIAGRSVCLNQIKTERIFRSIVPNER